MLIGAIREKNSNERRVPLTPAATERLVKAGNQVIIEHDLGSTIHVGNNNYIQAGARIAARGEVLKQSDILLRVRKPDSDDLLLIKPGAVHISFLDPFNEKDIVNALAARNISAISLEMIPRTTLAQKMDALSSQANLAGYVAVILAAERSKKILPMMMTPAGTISPARVFVIGAGVAGLQAIATAKRLGARVEAFDTRPVVKEQVQSLGAKFIEIDLGETGQTNDGYAQALTPQQLARQHAGMAKVCAASDIVITTAQIFGRKAPVIVTKDMVQGMHPGSVIVDMAIESDGNVDGSQLDKEIEVNGVRLIGLGNLPGHAAISASDMLAANFVNLIEHCRDKTQNTFVLKLDDAIVKSCLITHNGNIVNEKLDR